MPDTPRAAPLIGVCADLKDIDGRPYHAVGDKYVRAVALGAAGVPLIIPAMSELLELRTLLSRLDGLFLTGSPTNVHPRQYDTAPAPHFEPYDEFRDALTLPLIEQALALGIPLLAVCRGLQEMNVVLGGTLHPQIHAIPGRHDHRAAHDQPVEVQYGPSHEVTFVPGSRFETIAGTGTISVNSVHAQGIERLAAPLVAEGHAQDGTIEAVRVRDAEQFALGVQWHPEYRVLENEFSTRLFRAFGDAARTRRDAHPR